MIFELSSTLDEFDETVLITISLAEGVINTGLPAKTNAPLPVVLLIACARSSALDAIFSLGLF
jgi:hypothetical protein